MNCPDCGSESIYIDVHGVRRCQMAECRHTWTLPIPVIEKEITTGQPIEFGICNACSGKNDGFKVDGKHWCIPCWRHHADSPVEGKKYDGEKPRMDLLPAHALIRVSEVLTYGAKKYDADNWRKVKPRRRYFGAALRHLFARLKGERIDGESGLPHLAHAACCILFLLDVEEEEIIL